MAALRCEIESGFSGHSANDSNGGSSIPSSFSSGGKGSIDQSSGEATLAAFDSLVARENTLHAPGAGRLESWERCCGHTEKVKPPFVLRLSVGAPEYAPLGEVHGAWWLSQAQLFFAELGAIHTPAVRKRTMVDSCADPSLEQLMVRNTIWN